MPSTVQQPVEPNFYCSWSLEEFTEEAFKRVRRGWVTEGATMFRTTRVDAETPLEPYPPGVYLEGWSGLDFATQRQADFNFPMVAQEES